MNWQALSELLFPAGHSIVQDGLFLSGRASVTLPNADAGSDATQISVAVIGTCEHAEIGIEIALRQAQAVLDIVRNAPGMPIVLLVDTQGQRLRHRDEMLGINSYMAHLAKCVQLARQEGHVVLALVYDQALSGGFLSTGLMADACYALPAASIKVMDLGAMARITKIPLERLQSLAHSNPVFAPGPENFERMGAITAIWHDDLATHLSTALQNTMQQAIQRTDLRSLLGQERAGRNMAQQVIAAVLAEQRC